MIHRLTGQAGLIQEIIPVKPAPRVVVPGSFEVPTRVCLPDAIHLKVARREVSRLECEIRVAQRLLTEVIQAMLVVRNSAFVGTVRELPVQVEQTVFLVIERHSEGPVVGANASRAVEADSSFGPPLVLCPGIAWSVVHALLHHNLYLSL